MINKIIDIGSDFSRYPGGRYRTDGPASAEAFREDILSPAFLAGSDVTVKLDSTLGLSGSFLEETFGGLVRKHGYATIKEHLKFDTVDRQYLVKTIEQYMSEAAEELEKKK